MEICTACFRVLLVSRGTHQAGFYDPPRGISDITFSLFYFSTSLVLFFPRFSKVQVQKKWGKWNSMFKVKSRKWNDHDLLWWAHRKSPFLVALYLKNFSCTYSFFCFLCFLHYCTAKVTFQPALEIAPSNILIMIMIPRYSSCETDTPFPSSTIAFYFFS